MIDHVSTPVADLERSLDFYRSVLEPLDYKLLVKTDATAGFGKRYPEFWLNHRAGLEPAPATSGAHICLRALESAAVDQFHALAIAEGGLDDGAPGPRQAAFTEYYGAFIRDPDGNRIEALTFSKAND